MRARAGRRFQHAGTQALAAHLHQAEAGDAADLDAGAVVLERVLHRLLDLTDVGAVLHVDEVDDDEPGHVAQAELAGDLARGLEVGVERRRLDAVLLGRAARVDVDRDQRLGRVDDDVAARLQLHDRIVHRGELVLGAVALEQRYGIGVLLHPARVTGHEQLHEVLGGAVARLALDDDVLDVLVVDVADRALDEVAVRMDQRGRARLQRGLADLVPQAGEIVEIALDLGLGTAEPGGADDAAHRLRQAELADDRLEALAVAGRADLAGDAAAVAGVRHQHAIAAGEAEVGGEGGALVAALLLDDLDQQHLAALDHVLDLVAAAQRHALGAQLVGLLGAAAPASALAAATAAALGLAFVAFLALAVFAFGGVFVRLGVLVGEAVLDVAVLDRRDLVLIRGVDLGHAAVFIGLVLRVVGHRAFARAIVEVLVGFLGSAQRGLLLGVRGLLGQQRLAILLGDLVVVGMDLAERQEAVAVAAEIDEGRL